MVKNKENKIIKELKEQNKLLKQALSKTKQGDSLNNALKSLAIFYAVAYGPELLQKLSKK